jgi:hypothetical protein
MMDYKSPLPVPPKGERKPPLTPPKEGELRDRVEVVFSKKWQNNLAQGNTKHKCLRRIRFSKLKKNRCMRLKRLIVKRKNADIAFLSLTLRGRFGGGLF